MSETSVDAWNTLTNLNADIGVISNLLELAHDKEMAAEVFYLIEELKKKADALNDLTYSHGHLLAPEGTA